MIIQWTMQAVVQVNRQLRSQSLYQMNLDGGELELLHTNLSRVFDKTLVYD